MSDDVEHQAKILNFLMTEWERKDAHQLVEVDLIFAPGNGFRDEPIRNWIVADEPELFSEFVNIEKLAAEIFEIAEDEADAKPSGKHRFIVRTKQQAGEHARHSFALSPSDFGAPTTDGSRDQQALANHANQLMRINAQMFEGTMRVLSQQNMNLHEQVAALMAKAKAVQRLGALKILGLVASGGVLIEALHRIGWLS
jgi:hypothetical protein